MRRFQALSVVFALVALVASVDMARADFLVTFDSFAATANSEVPSATTSSGFTAVRPGHYSVTRPLILTVAGLKITVYRENGATFDIVDNSLNSQVNKGRDTQGNLITNWGARSIDGFSDVSNSPYVINFQGAAQPGGGEDPTGLLYFSLIAGDYGLDVDVLQMQAWTGRDGTGELLGVVSHPVPLPATTTPRWTEQRFHFAVDDEETDRIRSIRFFGGVNDIDVFLDRFAGSIGTNIVPQTSDIDGALAELIFDSNAQLIPEPATAILLGTGGLMLLRRRRR